MYVIIFSIDKNYEVCQELKNGGGGYISILKNPRAPRRTGQAPLTPLVRACPDNYREGVTRIEPQRSH
jgi:transcriptional regulator CtsR